MKIFKLIMASAMQIAALIMFGLGTYGYYSDAPMEKWAYSFFIAITLSIFALEYRNENS